MFECKLKDNDAGYQSMAGWYVWTAIQGLAMTQCGLHRRHLEVKDSDETRNVETSVGRLGNAHWDRHIKDYENKGYAGFCGECKSELCPINRNHICRILILYKLCIKVHMHYQSDLYVSDLGISHSDINRFIGDHIRRSNLEGRFGMIPRQTIPAFRDYSESVYAGGNIDLAILARPDLQ